MNILLGSAEYKTFFNKENQSIEYGGKYLFKIFI